jgi:site-specific DNA-methyltransferase (adenine-specific)
MLTRRTGDAREMCLKDEGALQLVITDPPYPTLERHRAVGTTTRLQGHTFDCLTHEDIMGVFACLGDRLDPGCYLIATVDRWSWMIMARIDGIDDRNIKRSARAPVGELTGLWWRTPWDWIKTTKDGEKLYGGMGYHGRRTKEDIMILQKPGKARPAVAEKLRTCLDVVFAPRIKHKDAYPTQKPQVLGSELLDAFAIRGDKVLDPFAGSGRWLIDQAEHLKLDLELWDTIEENEQIVASGDWP